MKTISQSEAEFNAFETEFGQTALAEGWGNSLVLEIVKTGRYDFTLETMEKFRKGHQAFREAEEDLINNPTSYWQPKVFLNLATSMREKNLELFEKYYKKGA